MLERLMKRKTDEGGFTLIELMVVVLIIGILIAIALPTFLGARSVEPSLVYVDGAPALSSTDIGIGTGAELTATKWAAARQSASGICFYISDSSTAGTKYGQAAASGACVTPTAALANTTGWT